MDPEVDWSTTRSLKIMSLMLSGVSLGAASLSMYWLVRMRRSFRHDLIMLLIASDIAKSLSFVIYSSATLNRPLPAEPGSTLCQVSGFFLAMAIEASDAAVFLIALHWTVYITRSDMAAGKSGIYPYRYLAFGLYVAFPAIMASLAFAKFPAYVDTGQYCYLPTTPWWKLMSLSWIPRYTNMAVSVVMYCASYVYVRTTMRRFGRQHGSVATGTRERQIPVTPLIIRHGLIPSPMESRRISFRVPTDWSSYGDNSGVQADTGVGFRNALRSRLEQVSLSSRRRSKGWPCQGLDSDSEAGAHTLASGRVSPRTGAAELAVEPTEMEHGVQPLRPSTSTLKSEEEVETPPSRLPVSRAGSYTVFYRRPLSITIEADEAPKGARTNADTRGHLESSQIHIFTALQQGPRADDEGGQIQSTPVASLDYGASGPGGISRGHDRIRRQLSFLFIYPAVYACVWVFPLVNDMIAFGPDDHQKPAWVMAASLASLCIQGLADTMVLCIRERPWRHAEGGFWENIGILMSSINFRPRNESGRTKEEMFHDGSRARLRREEEIGREQRADKTNRMSAGCTSDGSVYRHWWDAELPGDDEGGSEGNTSTDEEWQLSARPGDQGGTRTG